MSALIPYLSYLDTILTERTNKLKPDLALSPPPPRRLLPPPPL